MSKNIFRQCRRTNYTIVPNEFLNKPELSFKAKGILAYLLSLPQDWEVYLSHLKTISTDGYDGVASGIDELVTHKYIYRRPRSGSEPGGWEYFIYDEPTEESPFGDDRLGNSPTREIPDSGKSRPTKYYKEKQNTKKEIRLNPKQTTEEFVEELKSIYDYIDVDVELKRMDAWIASHPGRKKTRRFVIGWLNRYEKPLPKEEKHTSCINIQQSYRPCL